MTGFLLDRPPPQAGSTTRAWISEVLQAGGDEWDREAAITMTSEVLSSALAHTDRPVRLGAHRDGRAAQVSVHVHTSTLPETAWTAGSPLVEDLLLQLRRRTRHCGAHAQITPDGAEITIRFALPRKTRGIARLRAKS
ncbi:MAG TPA: hypothetical protein VKP64_00885 [Mycobacteriales bacterium]|nr:hypothetical protein [Mycobacteriales bacterium]